MAVRFDLAKNYARELQSGVTGTVRNTKKRPFFGISRNPRYRKVMKFKRENIFQY
jgi:hypothetical protein